MTISCECFLDDRRALLENIPLGLHYVFVEEVHLSFLDHNNPYDPVENGLLSSEVQYALQALVLYCICFPAGAVVKTKSDLQFENEGDYHRILLGVAFV